MLLRIFVCILFLGSEEVWGNETTLSTAKTRLTVSALPTTTSAINRRMDADILEDSDDAGGDNVDNVRRYNNNNDNDIWDWDFWCQLQPKSGNCTSNIPRYYYDAQLDKCLPFTYSGCHGNKNNFENLHNCERHCKGAAYMPIKDVQEKHFCSLQPSAGLCLALLPKYYYNLNEDKCTNFIYGGCGGNHNRFESEALCMAMCRGNKHFRRTAEHIY